MSGGHYNYASFSLGHIVDNLMEERGMTKQSDKYRKKLIKLLQKIQPLLYELEWFDSGDTGEESLLKIEKGLKKFNL